VNWKKSLGLLTWNNHIGEGKKWQIVIDGRGVFVEGNWVQSLLQSAFTMSSKTPKLESTARKMLPGEKR
jgi:hypothetical protein